jgi:hypothetical protein
MGIHCAGRTRIVSSSCSVANSSAVRQRGDRPLNTSSRRTASRSRRLKRARFAINFRPLIQRAQGMPGAQCARSRAWCVVNTRVSHHGHTGNTRHSPRNGFNGFLRALPGDRALLPPSSAVARQLDASVGASGPHDFAVRTSIVRLRFSGRRPNCADAAASTASPAQRL